MSSNSSADERHRRIFRGEVEEIKKLLKEQFDVELNLKFIIGGKGRVYAYKDFDCPLKGKSTGIYFGKVEKDGLRLSIEGSFVVGRVAKRGILEVDEDKAMKWLAGENIEANFEGFCILKWGQYFLGCGKGDGKLVRNYVPKDRRLSHGLR
ncbi:MAG: hypothetical protein NZ879_03820 [Archaeoglobaceae archaeon]|nr:hypothetical protein [Archaeoglobaceae archaeon]MDW8118092.1 hypothetical protein [Archaeoglobaceae archaeon]